MKDDNGLAQSGSDGGGEKGSDSEYMLKAEPKEESQPQMECGT